MSVNLRHSKLARWIWILTKDCYFSIVTWSSTDSTTSTFSSSSRQLIRKTTTVKSPLRSTKISRAASTNIICWKPWTITVSKQTKQNVFLNCMEVVNSHLNQIHRASCPLKDPQLLLSSLWILITMWLDILSSLWKKLVRHYLTTFLTRNRSFPLMLCVKWAQPSLIASNSSTPKARSTTTYA